MLRRGLGRFLCQSISNNKSQSSLPLRLNPEIQFKNPGLNPKQPQFHLGAIHRISSLSSHHLDKVVIVAGWVKSCRLIGDTVLFIQLSDGSSVKNLQLAVTPSTADWEQIKKIKTSCSIRAKGVLSSSQGKGQIHELKVSEPEHYVKVVGGCNSDKYPLAAKYHKPETLREVAHLRPRTTLISTIARVKNTVAYETHRFFQENGFLHVHTPIITTNDCEGAGQMFQVTTLLPPSGKIAQIPHVTSQKSQSGQRIVDYSQDFFKKFAGLTVSGQLAAQAYACSMMNVYTFGPTFRAENSHTTRHAAEFWMIEPEMAFADLQDAMDCAEAYLRNVCRQVLGSHEADLEWLEKFSAKPLKEMLRTVSNNRMHRMDYSEAVQLLVSAIESKKVKFQQNSVKWGDDLASQHERYLCEIVKGPVIVYNYPAHIKAFYMRLNEDKQTVASFDILVPGVGEVVGGSQREERLDQLESKMKELKMDCDKYSWYLDLRRYGSVPHAGFGVGFERLVQMVTGCQNIREVLAFPRTAGSANY